ncbi:SDR family NAD(P)-dependent oxidoreductase [Aquisediminimonas profunda]|uniref:SDR family NAD(P)-dependent oxidoreductase n=1 Tax=Aquisediminimonas profunda TaxID=1550733 RepID=UPI001C628260|nr:SDR family oxidoreductase [Aquisediminimonas profunda]
MVLAGKNAVITGAARGIGLAAARDLVKRGARVTLVDINKPDIDAAADALRQGGGDARAYVCDLREDIQVETLGQTVIAERGLPDLVINNAYVPVLGGIDEIILDDWRLAFDVNVLGYVKIIKAFAPAMRARGSGHFVNVVSPMGIMPDPVASSNLIPYCSTKGACIGLTGAMATALVPHGVGVSAFYPDVTNSWAGRPAGAASSEFVEGLRTFIEAGATPESSACAMLDGVEAGHYLISAEHGFEERLISSARAGFDPMAHAGGETWRA